LEAKAKGAHHLRTAEVDFGQVGGQDGADDDAFFLLSHSLSLFFSFFFFFSSFSLFIV
jgi:hypothetical protein